MTKTTEKITFTLNGWDGKSYDGETRVSNVYTTKFSDKKFVKVGKHFFVVTDKMHPVTNAAIVNFWM